MTDLLHELMNVAGKTKLPRYAREEGHHSVVPYSSEFRRIQHIPRRIWDDQFVEDITALFTKNLKTEQGSMSLWPIQAKALYEIMILQHAFLPIGVGQGKALISLLAPQLAEVERPLLLVPAALREQTRDYVIPQMSEHWKLIIVPKVMGYSELSLAKNHKFLDTYLPDMLILDECDYVRNPKSGRTRRLMRYFNDNPETKCVAMSGTITSKSLRDFAHIAQWVLHDQTPLPAHWQELSTWADALDADIEGAEKAHPGALVRFCREGESARDGFRRRLTETPGVIGSKYTDIGTALRIFNMPVSTPLDVKDLLKHVRTYWETPGGDVIMEAVALKRTLKQLALGFWYRWDPAPPEDWMEARRNWARYVRDAIKYSRGELDTELQVWNKCSLDPNETFETWKEVKHTFKPNTVANWVSDFAVKLAIYWATDKKYTKYGKGIIWTEYTEFARKLQEYSDIPYYGAGDSGILDADAPCILASRRAHGVGKNLQQFSRNLFVTPPSSGQAFEQALGRTHRAGQKATEVTNHLFLHTLELCDALEKARGRAKYIEQITGNRQKLNYADFVLSVKE